MGLELQHRCLKGTGHPLTLWRSHYQQGFAFDWLVWLVGMWQGPAKGQAEPQPSHREAEGLGRKWPEQPSFLLVALRALCTCSSENVAAAQIVGELCFSF